MDKVKNLIFSKSFSLISFQLNCEELVEGYENPVAGLTHSPEKEEAAEESDDEEISTDAGTSSKKKKSKDASSSKSISILSRTTSEFETCSAEKSVDFDPVQGKFQFVLSLLEMTRFILK